MVELEKRPPQFLTFRCGDAAATIPVQDRYRVNEVIKIVSTLRPELDPLTIYNIINKSAPDSKLLPNPNDLRTTHGLSNGDFQIVVQHFICSDEARKSEEQPTTKTTAAPLFLIGPEDKLEKKPRRPRSQKKPSRSYTPMLPRAQEIIQLPTPTKIWNSEDTNRRQQTEHIKELRQGLKLDITLSVLSLFRADALKDLNKKQRDSNIMSGSLPRGVSFYSVIGVDLKEDQETKERNRKKFIVTAVNETLDRLSGRLLKQVTTQKERQILDICMDLEKTGKTILDIKNAVREGFGLDLPDRSEATVA